MNVQTVFLIYDRSLKKSGIDPTSSVDKSEQFETVTWLFSFQPAACSIAVRGVFMEDVGGKKT